MHSFGGEGHAPISYPQSYLLVGGDRFWEQKLLTTLSSKAEPTMRAIFGESKGVDHMII